MKPGMILVGMADLNVTKAPGALTTLGLGSCIGIAIFDPISKVAGLAHIMLPDSRAISNNSNVAKFADTATAKLVFDMVKMGADRKRLKAKIAGGAQMFAFSSTNDNMQIGRRNAEASRAVLKLLNIPIIAEDVGENYGRTVELYADDGRYLIKTIGHGQRVI
ncbi:MAG: chemotaxis protein CheD [Defluviitaleaceae bacterium]|nr:chemotaxis protein CheD [Defluviitaleaceae bacterium]